MKNGLNYGKLLTIKAKLTSLSIETLKELWNTIKRLQSERRLIKNCQWFEEVLPMEFFRVEVFEKEETSFRQVFSYKES